MKQSKLSNSATRLALIAVLVATWAAPLAVRAEQAEKFAAADRHFNIPAGALAKALNRFAEITGIQLVYPSVLVQGLSSPGLSGDYTTPEALTRLIAGTGLSARMLSATAATLEPPPVSGARTLGAVQVEGEQTDGFASLNGFGAGAGANGSSDPTATEGTGSFTTNGVNVASKTPQALKDTPQSVSVITHERIQQQDLTDLTSALNYAPGVTLEVISSVESNFYSRGFQITDFQIDGGAPIDLNRYSFFTTTPNLAEYDNVQVLRGSDALYGGASKPGGVVNMQRKRPLDHFQVTGEVDAGSWNNYQAQTDVTGPIAFGGHLRGRLVVSDQDRDYFYDIAHQNKDFVYGVLEGDLGSNTIMRVGSSYEYQRNTGFDNVGLPRYGDGGDIHLPRSTNLSAAWDKYDFNTPEFFVTLEHKFAETWKLTLDGTRRSQNSSLAASAEYGLVQRGDTGNGDYYYGGYGSSTSSTVQYAANATLVGNFRLFDFNQTITVGADYSQSKSSLPNGNDFNMYVPIDVLAFNRDIFGPQPTVATTLELQQLQEQFGEYVSLNLQPIQALYLNVGVRVSSYKHNIIYVGLDPSTGAQTFSSQHPFHEYSVPTPYAGATYSLTPTTSLYASYADIYQVQALNLDPNGKPLPAIRGITYETGLKGAFKNGKLNASLALFYTDETNQAVLDPSATDPGNFPGESMGSICCYQNIGTVTSRGLDLEVSGEMLPGWQIQAGYTYVDNKYNAALINSGADLTANTQTPKHQLKLWTAYAIPGRLKDWTVGGGLRMESARYTSGAACSTTLDSLGNCLGTIVPFNFTQEFYAVVDLRVAYKINDHLQAAVNLTNLGDTRYYATAGGSNYGNFYGEPRAFMLSLRAAY